MPEVDAIAEAAARASFAARVRLGVYLAALPHLGQRPPSFEKGLARVETFPARQNPMLHAARASLHVCTTGFTCKQVVPTLQF